MFSVVAERAEATYEPSQCSESEGCIVGAGSGRIVPRRTGEAHSVRELHMWHANDGHLRCLEVFPNSPAPLLAAHGS
jgi:hypothetical protein